MPHRFLGLMSLRDVMGHSIPLTLPYSGCNWILLFKSVVVTDILYRARISSWEREREREREREGRERELYTTVRIVKKHCRRRVFLHFIAMKNRFKIKQQQKFCHNMRNNVNLQESCRPSFGGIINIKLNVMNNQSWLHKYIK